MNYFLCQLHFKNQYFEGDAVIRNDFLQKNKRPEQYYHDSDLLLGYFFQLTLRFFPCLLLF